jgi:IS5 family transposase
MATDLRIMYLRFRYRIGFETPCAEVTEFHRLAALLSHRHRRFGAASPRRSRRSQPLWDRAVDQPNEALLYKAMAAHVVKLDKVRADTTVAPANIAHPTDSGLLAKGVAKPTKTVSRCTRSGRPGGPDSVTAPGGCALVRHQIAVWLRWY